jgi:hypothetical protein
MTQKKQPKILTVTTNGELPGNYTNDMFRTEHPCKLPDDKWKEQMIMLYPELKANWNRHK